VPYLFDSDVLIYFVNDIPGAQQFVEGLIPAGAAMSVVGYMEALEGISRSANLQEARVRFELLVGRLLVMDVTVREARRCADLRSVLRQTNRRVRTRALDLLVAATALEHGLTLVTNNQADYRDIPGLAILPAQISTV
jgi:tRNA(fMet)-specific endonuclease VapC